LATNTIDVKITSIIIEPTFWAKPWSLPLFSGFVNRLRVSDPDIIVSVVYYEPQPLVSWKMDKGDAAGSRELFRCKNSEEEWNGTEIIGRWRRSVSDRRSTA